MTDKEKIIMFEKYMRDKGLKEEVIKYNILVVKLLVNEVLRFFDQNLENIDTYCFEEFTDMIRIIDEYIGGREGIKNMLEAMQELTEFLKQNKLIKGGKIAHYKRMFSNLNYYLDKYDMMTGRNDNIKEFIKNITYNKFSSSVIKLVDDVNVFGFKTLETIDKILNDIPIEKKEQDDEFLLIIALLIDLELLEEKSGYLEATKKGRSISRFPAEARYGALLYLLYYQVDWEKIIGAYYKSDQYIEFKEILYMLAGIFRKIKEVTVNIKELSDLKKHEMLTEISTDRFRIARLESISYGRMLLNICFTGMGLLDMEREEDGSAVYCVSEFGQEIFKIIYEESGIYIRERIESIGSMIKNKTYDIAEKSIMKYLVTYGGNTVIWDYLGQLLLLKRNYNYAYNVLKYGYEKSSKRGKASKSMLYHLVLCCRKLKINEEVENYERKLNSMERA